MMIMERAMNYAKQIHSGQVRKANPILPYIVHPINVAGILSEYFQDDNLICAGYLHDVIEDAPKTGKVCTIDMLKARFNNDIATLVSNVTEIDKCKSWEERKIDMVVRAKDADIRTKYLMAADKVSNLEDLVDIIEQKGEEEAFRAFKRSRTLQEWYNRAIYGSLIADGAEHELFTRLRNAINKVF